MPSKSYTERKEAWAQRARERGVEPPEERSAERLPPGQHLTKEFPVLDLGIHPDVPLDEWRLEITGLVERPMLLNWEALQEFPQIEDVSDFHCVTTWSKFDCRWSGVSFETILDAVRPFQGAAWVFYTAYDGYTTNTAISELFAEGALLAHSVDGKPLSKEHGGPLRAIFPHLYAWKGAKFIRKIEFRDHDELGYWEKRGYSNHADPWMEERFSV